MSFGKNLFLFFKNNFNRNNHCKLIQHKRYLKPFLSYLPCIVHREYFSINSNDKKCALYSINTLRHVHDGHGEACHAVVDEVRPPIVNVIKLFTAVIYECL